MGLLVDLIEVMSDDRAVCLIGVGEFSHGISRQGMQVYDDKGDTLLNDACHANGVRFPR